VITHRSEWKLTEKHALMLSRAVPTEVVQMILSYIPNDDKHSLAQCMRVSSTFNAIAAPLLYRSVKIDNTVKYFFAAPRQSEELVRTRRTADKAFNFGYVKELGYKTHNKKGCTPVSRVRKWDSLVWRVPMLLVSDAPSQDECRLCSCLQRISPRKVVYKGDGLENYMNQFISHTGRETTVSIMAFVSQIFNSHIRLLYEKPAPSLKHSIFIFPARSWYAVEPAYRHWRSVRNHLFAAVLRSGTPNNIVLVNIESLFAGRLESGEYKDMSAADSASLDTQNEYLKALSTGKLIGLRWYKSEEEARKVTFKFVSMETYLAEYDWEAEFTKEQVSP
jgi:hypothetical protein